VNGYDRGVRATLVALCLLTGCRQVLGIEPSVLNDADEGTADGTELDADPTCGADDFDNDSIGDNCDLCPHIASANRDVDADGVGDECDPRPQTASDERALWLAFHSASDILGWSAMNGA
jgi:hypothetical protein